MTTPDQAPLRAYSDGAGTQSIAVMILQIQGKLPKPYDVFVFSNVGDDSENPETLAYRREYILPLAQQHGLNLVEVQRIYKGQPITLLQFIEQQERTIPIPVYFSEGGKGNRKCTYDFKVGVVQRYLKELLKSMGQTHVELGIGFSIEEGARIYKKYPDWHNTIYSRNSQPPYDWQTNGRGIGFWQKYEFPLAELRLRKSDCIALVKEFGLPEPPPSLCWFCPFTARRVWMERKMTGSEHYTNGIALETRMNDKYQGFRSHPKKSARIGLHPDLIPLSEIGEQYTLWDQYMDTDQHCDIGQCGL